MRRGAEQYDSISMSALKNEINKKIMQRYHKIHQASRSNNDIDFKKFAKSVEKERKNDPYLEYYSDLTKKRERRQFFLQKLNSAYCTSPLDKSDLWFFTRLFIWITYPYTGNSFNSSSGHDYMQCGCNSSEAMLTIFPTCVKYCQSYSKGNK